MCHFKQLLEEALGSHGVVTYRTIRGMGILSPEIARWIRMGRLQKVGRGVYRLTSIASQGAVTDMAMILAEVGPGAYLFGESVLGFLELCPVRSYVVFVATPARIRKRLSNGIKIVRGDSGYRPIHLNGIPCQRVDDAIITVVGSVENERLLAAVSAAEDKGYFTAAEATDLKKRIVNGHATTQRTRA